MFLTKMWPYKLKLPLQVPIIYMNTYVHFPLVSLQIVKSIIKKEFVQISGFTILLLVLEK